MLTTFAEIGPALFLTRPLSCGQLFVVTHDLSVMINFCADCTRLCAGRCFTGVSVLMFKGLPAYCALQWHMFHNVDVVMVKTVRQHPVGAPFKVLFFFRFSVLCYAALLVAFHCQRFSAFLYDVPFCSPFPKDLPWKRILRVAFFTWYYIPWCSLFPALSLLFQG